MSGNVLTIEAKQKGTREYYKEVVCVIAQYPTLIKKPENKVRDSFKMLKGYIAICAVLLAIILAMAIAWGVDTLTIVAVVVMLACIAVGAFQLHRLNGMVTALMGDSQTPVFTLDEEGVEFEKKGSQLIRVPWENVAFVRVFDESVCFFARGTRGPVLAINKYYEQQILSYLECNNIDVNVIGTK